MKQDLPIWISSYPKQKPSHEIKSLLNAIKVAETISNRALLGKLISSRSLNKHTFHTILKAVWSFILGLIIEDLGINTYHFTFPFQQDKNHVFYQWP